MDKYAFGGYFPWHRCINLLRLRQIKQNGLTNEFIPAVFFTKTSLRGSTPRLTFSRRATRRMGNV